MKETIADVSSASPSGSAGSAVEMIGDLGGVLWAGN